MDRNQLGKKLDELRRNQNLTKSDVSTKARLPDIEVLVKIERGDPSISTSKIDRVMAVLGLSKKCVDLGIVDSLESGEQVIRERQNPYKGLAAYGQRDKQFFFGREDFVNKCLEKLNYYNALIVIGPSGVGKSSAINAGVIPRLLNMRQAKVVSFRPGARPIFSLALEVKRTFPNSPLTSDISKIVNEIEKNPVLFFLSLRSEHDRDCPMVFAIDQFEEIFSPRCDKLQSATLARVIYELSTSSLRSDWLTKIILTVRADFYQLLVNQENIVNLVNEQKPMTLGPMSNAELKEAITKPAELCDKKISPSLIEMIISDVSKTPGSLPHMAYCLQEMWDITSGKTIGAIEYEQIGRIEGAIAAKAEQVYLSETDEGQEAIKRLFGRLVMVSTDGADQFQMRSKILLKTIASDELEFNIAQKLIKARLLSTDFNEVEEDSTIELAHEAIIFSWTRLKSWLEEDSDFIRWIQLVKPMAARWEAATRDKNKHLLTGQLILEAETLYSERRKDIERIVSRYLEASIEANEQKKHIQASSKLDVILNAEPGRLIEKIEDARLAGYLHPTFLNQKLIEAQDDINIWKLRLAVLTEDKDHLQMVLQKLDTCLHDELFSICFFLQKISLFASEELRTRLENEACNDEVFIRRAAALAYVSKDVNHLSAYSYRCSSIISHENPLLVREFILAFRPVRAFLYDHLLEIASNIDFAMPVRDTAALAILELFDTDIERLVPLLCECNFSVYEVILDKIASSQDNCKKLEGILTRKVERHLKTLTEEPNLGKDRAIARAAATVARIGSIDKSCGVLDSSQSIDIKSQFAFLLPTVSVNASKIAHAFIIASNIDRIYWLGISLGEFLFDEFDSSTQKKLLESLLQRYETHLSSCVHGICGWLLRLWGYETAVDEIDIKISIDRVDLDREWFNLSAPTGIVPFVVIQPGSYERGSPENEIGFAPFEGPVHQAEVSKSIAVAARGVTVGEYDAFCKGSDGYSMPLNIAPFSSTDMHPIISITWGDANKYCDWFSSETLESPSSIFSGVKSKFTARLPTDIEWEYFCRAGTNTPFSFGSDISLLKKFAWFQDNSNFTTQPFHKLRPNPWGIFDIHGNTWEWCQNPYVNFDGSELTTSIEGQEDLRPLKGGGWNLHFRYCRSACRNWHNAGNRNYYTGMRLILEKI